MLGTILVVLFVLILLGALPTWPHMLAWREVQALTSDSSLSPTHR
jgi:hypothetical protein